MKTTFIVKDFHDELLDKALANPVWDAFKVIESGLMGIYANRLKLSMGLIILSGHGVLGMTYSVKKDL